MDPEKPPRRKKSGESPVTIDLEAVPAAEEGTATTADSTTTGVSPAAEEAVGATTATDEKSKTDATGPRQTIADTAPAGATEEATATSPAWRHEAIEPPQPRPSKSGAFAAAILGGLVALAGAGALQYGGYLPALGPDRAGGIDVASLNAEIEALKSQLSGLQNAGPAPSVDLQPIETRLATLERSAAAASAATTIGGGAEQSIATLEASVAKLTADIAALREQATNAARDAADRSAQLTERLAAAEQKLAEPQNDVAMARAVAATALKTAIDRGGPYLAELEAFVSVAPDDPAVATLRTYAATGVPSRSDLVRTFDPVADQMIEAVHLPTGDQGIVDRLLYSATSAIKIRPVGSVEGDTPEAVIARIENKLQNGDLKGAQIEWQALPEVARNAGAAFKARLDERIAIEDGVNAIVSGAMAPKGTQG